MDHSFWHNAWARTDAPGWQQTSANKMLRTYWSQTDARAGETVFVPLCGRSPDLTWLQRYGHHVVGVDLSLSAIQRFCDESEVDFSVSTTPDFTVFSASNVTLYAGDFFAMQPALLEQVSRVYDRAALVAMPPDLRVRYVEHLQHIVPVVAEYLTIAISYDQAAMQGPPFSVPESEVRQHFAKNYKISLLHREESSMPRRGLATLEESVYRVLPEGHS